MKHRVGILIILVFINLPVLAADTMQKPKQSLPAVQAPLKKQVPVDTTRVHQPVATQGGTPAEPVEEAESRVPQTLRHRERAVTADDVKPIAPRTPGATIHRVSPPAPPRPKPPVDLSNKVTGQQELTSPGVGGFAVQPANDDDKNKDKSNK